MDWALALLASQAATQTLTEAQTTYPAPDVANQEPTDRLHQPIRRRGCDRLEGQLWMQHSIFASDLPFISHDSTFKMASGDGSKHAASRNIFDSVALVSREEDDCECGQLSEREMSDKEEVVLYSSDSDGYSGSYDSDNDVLIVDPDLKISIAEEVVDGTVIKTVVYMGKDGTEWKNTPLVPNAQTRWPNVTLPRNRIPGTQNVTSPAEVFELFISRNMLTAQSYREIHK
ncbi:hypothetical protein ElyMa_001125900 [Elysia marginata]|uniref:Uncharacterized protein n=1 Tax=Elysia marginata TaxID=1093978 RepID=A0AAV4HX67_9GAST|nr:hypothetical protein ElyMa_001125900 [Elysia marginata]